MVKPIRVIQFGLGAIGRAAAALVLQRPKLQLVGAVDRDPQLIGRDLGDVLELDHKLGIPVTPALPPVLAKAMGDVVIHCTGSHFADVFDQFADIAGAGLHCVTSCEEALFPYYRAPQLAEKLDQICQRRRVAFVGTGVNPGFVMDTLALTLTAVSQRIDSLSILRVVDAGTRRAALQRKIGAGLAEAEFRALVEQHKIGHVGLTESLVFVAAALGWNLDEVDESIAPVIADDLIKTKFLSIKKGAVAGQRQFARGLRNGREVITLELQMFVGAQQPRDEIRIAGEPPLHLVIDGGTPGDLATPAILVNLVPRVTEARPGLHTMRTLGLPRFGV